MIASLYSRLILLVGISTLGLKLQKIEEKEIIQNLQDFECVAEERVHPYVDLVAKWFPKHGFKPVPIALTALSAFRFGGMSISLNKKNLTFDDDLDFILVPQQTKKIDLNLTLEVVRHFADEAERTSGRKTQVVGPKWNVIFQRKDIYTRLLKDHSSETPPNRDLMHIGVFVDEQTEVSDNIETVAERVAHDFFGLPPTHLEYSDAIRKATSIDGAFCCQPWEATALDFWIDISGRWLSKQEQHATNKPLLLSGVVFDAPWPDAFFSQNFFDVACAEWGREFGDRKSDSEINKFCQGAASFCDFSLPAFSGYDMRLLSGDLRPEQVQERFHKCARKLHQQGYRSFITCI